MQISKKLFCFILLFFIYIVQGTNQPVQAASGCCEVIRDTGAFEISASETTYLTIDSADCEKQKGPNTKVTFEEGKQASDDKKSCEDISGTTDKAKPSKPIPPELQVSIPGFGKFSDVTCDDPDTPCQFPWIGEYIKAIYDYGTAVVGILSVIVMMIGGVIRLTAGGNHSQISQGNTYIKSSILGVIFTLCSYMILFIVSPNLTILQPVNISYIDPEELDDIIEPIPFETVEKIKNYPQNSGKIDTNSSNWVPVPHDKNNLGIWLKHGSGSEKSSQASVEALKKAAQCWKSKGTNNSIRISDASRSLGEQQALYKSNCVGKAKCSPPTCNPYNGLCPHTSGGAFDAWACIGSDCVGKNQQMQMQECFLQAGFCLLRSECWHFEYPTFSSNCGTTKHYTGKYCI